MNSEVRNIPNVSKHFRIVHNHDVSSFFFFFVLNRLTDPCKGVIENVFCSIEKDNGLLCLILVFQMASIIG